MGDRKSLTLKRFCLDAVKTWTFFLASFRDLDQGIPSDPRDMEVSWSLRNPEVRSLGDEDQLKQIKFTPMSTKLLELDRRYFDAWHNHDADAIAAAFAENSTYTHPALPEPLVGGPAVAEWAKTVWTILPDFKLDLVSRDATENGIVVNEWVYSGTDTGPHPDGTPPTERAAKSPGITISQYEGDTIRWQRVYMDRLDEQLQYGNVELKHAQHVQVGS